MNTPTTIPEMTGQMIMAGFEGTTLTPETEELIRKYHVGGLILFSRNYENPEQLYTLIRDAQDVAASSSTGLPLFISVDQEGGRVARLTEPFTQYPPFCCLGNSGSEDLARRFGQSLAAELADVGINMDYAPVLDVHTNPDNPIIGDRAIGSDPETVAKLANAFIEGFRAKNMIPVGKHFPGHGDTHLDSHLDLPTVDRDAATLEAVELLPFKETIARGLEVIMTAHVIYTAWDKDNPATFSKTILQDILRKRLGFQGIIMSDDLEMKAVENYFPFEAFPRMGVEAGLDMFLICNNVDKVRTLHDQLTRDVNKGTIPTAPIQQSVERILHLKKNLTLPPAAPPNPGTWMDTHSEVSREMGSYSL
ncbi:MAG: beta-N-acetylhexosaminidase [Nitrospinota bacterium]|nr:beta-N-acetylhexosaminidase [Nitrospinota bacterium]